MAKGRAEVMRYGVCKRFQLFITSLELSRALTKFFVECTNLLLPVFALGDIIAGLHDDGGPPLLVAPQRPPARHDHHGSVCFGVLELAIPASRSQQLRADVLEWRRKSGPQEVVRRPSDRVLLCPAVQLQSAPIPVSDVVLHITDEDGVVREIQQAGLL